MHVVSIDGNKYIMIFIDDYTKRCRNYLLKDKSQAFETFKNFHVWIENESQIHIGSLRTNNGREHTSNEFKVCLRQHGIRNQTKIPYNP